MLAWLAAAAALSFISERDGNREVYVIAADGSGERRITRSGDADYNGPITPDGKYLLVTSVSELQHEKQQRFFLYPTAGGVPKPLGPIRSLLRHPTFSRDGRFLFFEGSSTDLREIFRLQIDGQKLIPITKNREGNFQPCLSPTGDRLAFVSSRDQVAELYASSPMGGPARRLTQTERDEWQPTGNGCCSEVTAMGLTGSTGSLSTVARQNDFRPRVLIRLLSRNQPAFRPMEARSSTCTVSEIAKTSSV